MNYAMRNLVVAVLLAAVGLFLMTQYVTTQKHNITKGQTRMEVVVAAKDIPAGTPASVLQKEGYTKIEQVVREDVQPQALPSLEGVKKLSVSTAIFAGQQVSAHAFETSANLKITDQLKGTERGMSIKINPANSVAGLINPGDHIDLMASTNSDKATWVVARDITVLGTPASLNPNQDPAQVKATGEALVFLVKVTDEQAQYIAWAQTISDEEKLVALLRPSDKSLNTGLKTLHNYPGEHPVLTTTPRADNTAVKPQPLPVPQYLNGDPQ